MSLLLSVPSPPSFLLCFCQLARARLHRARAGDRRRNRSETTSSAHTQRRTTHAHTDACAHRFITGGTDSGIMKYVGEARAKYNPSAPLIGIASLPVVAGGKQLRDMSSEKATPRKQFRPSENEEQSCFSCFSSRKPEQKTDDKLPERPTYKYIQAGLGIELTLFQNGECGITGMIDCPGIAGRVEINDVIVSIDSVPVAGLKLAEIEKAMVRDSQTSSPTQTWLSSTMYLTVEYLCSEERTILR